MSYDRWTSGPDHADELRAKVVDRLCADGTIVSPEIEAAMRKVPRHAFLPKISLQTVYDAYTAVVINVAEDGSTLSAVSSPHIHALMLEQAQVRPGMSVLEIGSGGLNAAYIAELAGPYGVVTTADIDEEVTDRTACLLAGYYPRIRVVTADAAEPIPFLDDQFDVIMVTAGAWDIPPAWISHLKPGGRLVVPLRMRGLVRCVSFRADGHLESESVRLCGLMPLRGSAAHREERLLVAPGVELCFDDELPADVRPLDRALETGGVEMLTGVTAGPRDVLETLHMHLAIALPGFCTMTVDPHVSVGIITPDNRGFSLAAVDGETFGYLTSRRAQEEGTVELAFHAFGPDAWDFAAVVVKHVREWADRWRDRLGPVIRVYPASTPDGQILGDRIIAKRHSRISLAWPTA
ncbi:methyltransferase, FxLD system [Streptomyces sp. 110]|uniref:Protein-L-isoaspartate O-methyltransferase n=1 Tax=Streptomyces endocoffeicus TaxID=2898945 RepID=A0ABS1PS69_9ACTN|nr:methyltransferase, FxLD system [Streptomyces endocoffeicus]MBL1115276.1 methyltransferase, FxLD system [Streptomyces endocoffeicus]